MSSRAMVCARAALAIVLAGSLMLAGCSIPRNLEIDDKSATTYSARSVVRVGSRQTSGIEVAYAQFRAEDSQILANGERVTLDAASVFGPANLHNRARVQTAHIAYNHLFFPARPVEMELIGGLGGLRVTSRAQPADGMRAALHNRTDRGVLSAGIGPRWKFAEHFALEGRLGTVFTVFCNEKCGYMTTADVALAFSPVKQLRLRAGYFKSVARLERKDIDQSSISIEASGPQVGLAFEF